MERKLMSFWFLPLTLLVTTLSVEAKHNSVWDDIIKTTFKHSKVLRLTAGREVKPQLRFSPKVISFKGVVQLPSHIYLWSGGGSTNNIAGQIIIDGQIVCNYSARSSNSKSYYFNDCSDGSDSGNNINVNNKIELKLNYATSDRASLFANVKIVRADDVSYGIVFPYIQATEGQILMFNGEAWVAADPSDLDLKGLQGEQGLQGEPGPMGPQGPAGVAGAQGEKGDKGDAGVAGPQGPKGDDGVAGPAGPTGSQGLTGATGPMGPAGAQGLQGPTGATGPKGDDGVAGPVGATGPQGLTGATGPAGPQGLQGPAGEQGPAGVAGAKGDKGDKGDRGLSEIAYLRDQKASGNHGGKCTSGSWIPRTLNTLGGDSNFISLSNNRFTLQPGTYFIEIVAPGHGIGQHQAKLKVIETNADVLYGTNVFSHSTASTTALSVVMGEIIITETSSFEIQHRCATTKDINGFGIAASFGSPEIYTQVKIIKKQ